MTVSKKCTLVVVLGLGSAVALWDVGLAFDGESGNTISSVLQSQSWAAGALGFISTHISRKPGSKALIEGWWGLAAGATVALGASVAIGGGIWGLVLGAAVGWLTWSNEGKS